MNHAATELVHERRASAFTLTELMIIVVVLAIIAVIVTPSARDESTQLRMAAARMIADIEYAQIASIGREDDRCQITFDPAGQNYYVSRASDPLTPITHPVNKDEYRVRFGAAAGSEYPRISLQSVNGATGDVLVFGAHGALQDASDVSVTLSAGASSVTIAVDSATGLASMD